MIAVFVLCILEKVLSIVIHELKSRQKNVFHSTMKTKDHFNDVRETAECYSQNVLGAFHPQHPFGGPAYVAARLPACLLVCLPAVKVTLPAAMDYTGAHSARI